MRLARRQTGNAEKIRNKGVAVKVNEESRNRPERRDCYFSSRNFDYWAGVSDLCPTIIQHLRDNTDGGHRFEISLQ